MNFIFDIGNVLISYNPRLFLYGLFSDKSLAESVGTTIFLSPEWRQLDQGLLTHEEATAIFCAREPAFREAIEKVMHNVFGLFTPISDTVALLPEVKKAGHSLYYLSNISHEVRDHLLSEYQFFGMFDGGVFSCDIHVLKPSAAIYRQLLEDYSLSPADCLFFDDVEENVMAARKEGINGIVFTGAECVLPFLD